MMKKTMQMMTAALLLVSGLVTAGEVKLPEPQSGLIVLPKGIERKAYPGSAFLGGGMKDAVAEVGLFDQQESRRELERIADVCRHVPAHAPRNFWEALHHSPT